MLVLNFNDLSPDALHGIASSYVDQMQGSDYDETPYDERVNAAISSIKAGLLTITFSEHYEEVRVVDTAELQRNKISPFHSQNSSLLQ